MLRYVRDQAIQLREGLIARVAVIMIFAFQLAERSAAALFRPVESVRRGRAHRRHDWWFYNDLQDLSVRLNRVLANARDSDEEKLIYQYENTLTRKAQKNLIQKRDEPWCTEVRMDSTTPGSAGSLGGPLTG